MVTRGGAMSGYFSSAKVLMARVPASITTMAITQAKMGRSMKKRAMRLLRSEGRGKGLMWERVGGVWLQHIANLHLLTALGDDALARLQAGGYEPAVAYCLGDRERALLHGVVCIDDESAGGTAGIACDRLLRHQQGLLDHRGFRHRAHVHAGEQQ